MLIAPSLDAHILQQGVKGLLMAVLFWSFAIYGALMLVLQSVHGIQRRKVRRLPITLILVVQNAGTQIEGVLRTLMLKTAFKTRERRILVIDVSSVDDTGVIVRKMSSQHHCLEYVHVESEEAFLAQLKSACMDPNRIGCIYDLRYNGMLRNITDDIAWMCQ